MTCNTQGVSMPYPDNLNYGKKRNIKSIIEFGVPDERENSKPENCKRSKEFQEIVNVFCVKKAGFLTFVGNSGNGKTYTACAILEGYRRTGRTSARFINMSDFHSKWKDRISSNISDRSFVEPYFDVELLVLDDIGTKEPSPSFLDLLYLLIEKRSMKYKTILTSNLNTVELKNYLGDRIFSRIGSGEIINFQGPDERFINKSC
jgi:DNA replication protein DnaC